MAKIAKIKAREILDSRANPTVSVDVMLDSGMTGRFSVPSGASKGINEALEIRDGDTSRYHGMGVLKAVSNVNTIIARKIVGQEADQEKIDQMLIDLDGTKNKRNLGANAIIGVSAAVCKAGAATNKIPLYQHLARLIGLEMKKTTDLLPAPLTVLINGGVHAQNNLEFQEFMISPIRPTFSEKLRVAVEIFQALTHVLKEKAYSLALGDEGGYGPNLPNNEEAIKVLLESITHAGYIPERDVILGLDVASSSLWRSPKYILQYEKKSLSVEEMIGYFKKITKLYPIKVLEDPLAEEDWSGWKKLTAAISGIELVGDDLFATNVKRLQRGIDQKAANAILIKPNQIGTLTEMFKTIRLAKKSNLGLIVSHRSGETEDSFIADLAFAAGAKYLKAGAPERGERVIKYNRLLEIEEEMRQGAK